MSLPANHVDALASNVVRQLLARRNARGHWQGHLSSSALSTATAVIALQFAGDSSELVERGLDYLVSTQNPDGGFGDTPLSKSNISTTALCWAAFGIAGRGGDAACRAIEAWLARAAGSLRPDDLQRAISARYGKDRTFSVPILTALAISGRLGAPAEAWRYVSQLPFELAAIPPRLYRWLRMPVVSYALPALIAIGLARHRRWPAGWPARWWRNACAPRVLSILEEIQPSSGGFLEAVPLTSFVAMSMLAAGLAQHRVTQNSLSFLRNAARPDGSWPIDSNLATWVSTLAVNALAADGHLADRITAEERAQLAGWLLAQQHLAEHPYTRAAPGGWAWTDLPGGVPDADDTAGALLALHHLAGPEARVLPAAQAGLTWLCGLQNSDGGVPTFCRGWGYLPFDRSSPDLTAHALRAWTLWQSHLGHAQQARIAAARAGALRYLAQAQQPDGRWVPLWFGNQHAADDENPAYGTARVLTALAECRREPGVEKMALAGIAWLRSAQNADGGWGGAAGTPSSIEETAMAVDAILHWLDSSGSADESLQAAAGRGLDWLSRASHNGAEFAPSPIGFYFAKLWYFEELYPVIFAASALLRAPRHASAHSGPAAHAAATPNS